MKEPKEEAKGFFPEALQYVLKNEGGFVNDPADSGKATNMGITQATLSSWKGAPATVAEVKALTLQTASTIYYARYWCPLSLGRLTQRQIAFALFDCGVLFGPGTSALYTQKTLPECGKPGIALDGHIGLETISALNAVKPELFLPAFTRLLLERIRGTVEAHPRDQKFRNGWENRVSAYPKL